MANLERRIRVLERSHGNARPMLPWLAIVIRPEQSGEPTGEQAERIAKAKEEGRGVVLYEIV